MKLSPVFKVLLFLFLPVLTKAQIGNPAPNFTVTDTHGNTHTLYDYLNAGKTVVLDFFYTTCGPCQFYSPQVNLAFEKYGCNTANVIFMAIDYQDTNAEVLAYDQQYKIQYPSVSGTQGGGNAVVAQYGVFAFPTFYVIDSSKTIIEEIDPPTLQVFDYRFRQHGILPADCNTTAIQETPASKFRLYPNPVVNGSPLNLSFSQTEAGMAEYQIFNLIGQLVKNGRLDMSKTSPTEIETDDLHAGAFLLKISPTNGGETLTRMFVKE